MTREEIDRWYANIPEGKEVEETRVFDVTTIKYYTVSCRYVDIVYYDDFV